MKVTYRFRDSENRAAAWEDYTSGLALQNAQSNAHLTLKVPETSCVAAGSVEYEEMKERLRLEEQKRIELEKKYGE